MTRFLVIVESPAKIKTLRKFLGPNYFFESSIGHIRDLPAKEFVGLAVNVMAPDHSTLSVFRTRLLELGLWQQFEGINDHVLHQAQAAGIQFGKIQVVDSVHTVADVDNDADCRRQDQGKPPRDPQAQLVNKGKHSVK